MKEKRMLAIKDNSLFFGDAINLYEYLARIRCVYNQYKKIHDTREVNKEKGTWGLEEMFNCVLRGQDEVRVRSLCSQYMLMNINRETIAKFGIVRGLFDYVYVFTSYPIYVLDHLIGSALVDCIYGVSLELQWELSKKKIIGMSPVVLLHPNEVDQRFAELRIGSVSHDEPDRYGLLARLIDQMISDDVDAENVFVLGTGMTAQPMHRLVPPQNIFSSIDELLSM